MQIGKMATFTPNSIIILIFDLFHVGVYADFEAFLEFFQKNWDWEVQFTDWLF